MWVQNVINVILKDRNGNLTLGTTYPTLYSDVTVVPIGLYVNLSEL